MITIYVAEREGREYWDPQKEEFVSVPRINSYTLNLEHSLISISKWESKWHVPFISKDNKTEEQTLDYIKCMTIDKNVPDAVYENLTVEDIKKISEYINDPMSATTVTQPPGQRKSSQIVTSEVIYSWMVGLQIPLECEKWHLNRLMKLIEVCSANQTPPKKMGKEEIMSRNKALNAARRAKYNTKG